MSQKIKVEDLKQIENLSEDEAVLVKGGSTPKLQENILQGTVFPEQSISSAGEIANHNFKVEIEGVSKIFDDESSKLLNPSRTYNKI